MKGIRISLAAARVNANLTQADIAERMHITKQTVCNWENGKSAPSILQARELSELYKIPLDYIFIPEKSN